MTHMMMDENAISADVAIVSDRADLAETLGQVDEMALSLISNSRDCIKLLLLDGSLVFMNANGRCAMAVDDFDAIRGKAWGFLWPDDMRDTIAAAVRIGRRGGVARFVGLCPTEDGQTKTWDVLLTPVYETDGPAMAGPDPNGVRGQPAYLIAVSKDVTEEFADPVPAAGIRLSGFSPAAPDPYLAAS